MFFIPGVLVGSVLGFVSFGVASLRTDAYSRTLGVLLLIPAILVVTNVLRFIVGLEVVMITLGIVIGDALAMLALGYVLRTEPTPTDRAEPAPTEVRHG
jgi:low temperature requirement protein LtrA